MSILIFATHSVVDEILYIISFFCKVLILLQIALQGRIKNKHVDENCVVCCS